MRIMVPVGKLLTSRKMNKEMFDSTQRRGIVYLLKLHPSDLLSQLHLCKVLVTFWKKLSCMNENRNIRKLWIQQS